MFNARAIALDYLYNLSPGHPNKYHMSNNLASGGIFLFSLTKIFFAAILFVEHTLSKEIFPFKRVTDT